MQIEYDGSSIVTITHNLAVGEDFDEALRKCSSIMTYFRPSRSGSTWGMEGVAYNLQRTKRQILLHKSGVGPRNYRANRATVQEHFKI